MLQQTTNLVVLWPCTEVCSKSGVVVGCEVPEVLRKYVLTFPSYRTMVK